jgi:hypothetical protein
MSEEVKLTYTRECATCDRLFDCKGKPSKNPCVNYKERRKDGRNQVDKNYNGHLQ